MTLRALLNRLGRIERLFLLLLALFAALQFLEAVLLLRLVLAGALAVTGTWVGVRLVRHLLGKVTWRLRNRLIVAYLFIAVVPVLLLLSLAALGAREMAGQIAVYLVHSEFERRMDSLRNSAQALARAPAAQRALALQRIGALFAGRFPGMEILIRRGNEELRYPPESRLAAPPNGWREASGVVAMGEILYEWARVVEADTEATVVVPLTRKLLGDLAPGIGEISIVHFPDQTGDQTGGSSGRAMRLHDPLAGDTATYRPEVPPAVNRLDLDVRWAVNLPVAVWESPQTTENALLGVHSRISAVIRILSSQKAESSALLLWLYSWAVLFGLVEVISVFIGVRITRTITGAVHDLYEGTQYVQAGDFSHRIAVKGGDQVAELSRSFNQMTESVQRLLVVAKENERIQADLEIAREVQNQLYPRAVPAMHTLQIQALCHPARTVSGDYYDYHGLNDSKVALAIGDVAGKGISAALLMATLQSSLRMQLRAFLERAAAAGSGGAAAGTISTSRLVDQINLHLHANTSPEKFATFFFAVYDDVTGLLTYTNAGHLPPLLVRGGAVTPLDVNGMVVGAFPFAKYGESRLQLERGDLLVCYTDGITEPENEYSEMFGDERLTEVLLKNAGGAPEQIAGAVFDAVQRFTGSPELQDDMTMLVARRT